ncbi:hypothetical protein V6N13_118566 [Hibiscus sabdariffa]|uniref:Disease resistance R13L4/SHOC-2-like LRR domain-containing protein n=1 Tax=Hibiscus sabdariffa TaxID=183260 RepID=A0ABR2NWD3_9ROSI
MSKASISTLYLHQLSLVFFFLFSKLLLSANSATHPADVQVRQARLWIAPSHRDHSRSSWLLCFTLLTLMEPPLFKHPGYLRQFFLRLTSDSFSNLTRLRRLGLSGNSLTGEIPTVLGSLPHLEELYLDNNHLHGPIPWSFNNLTRLKRLEIQRNYISGELPDLASLKSLYFLDASDNNISGGVPSTLPLSLVELSMRNNKIRGNIPDSIDKIRFLQVLDLSHNMLYGAISSVVFKHPSLEQLTLSYNNFSLLQAPGDKGSSSSLIALDLSYNKLRGLLPAFMASMPKLTALSLEHNEFTGMIPAQYAVKAAAPGNDNTSSFERLLLGGNYLFGPIPGPLMGLKPGSADVSLVDNCLYRCPDAFFFCRGRDQKSLVDCKSFGPTIP